MIEIIMVIVSHGNPNYISYTNATIQDQLTKNYNVNAARPSVYNGSENIEYVTMVLYKLIRKMNNSTYILRRESRWADQRFH